MLFVGALQGDQPMNAAKMFEAGFAEFIYHHDVTPDRVQAKLSKLLNPQPDPTDPDARHAGSYVAAARRQQALVRTLSKHNTETAADMLLFFARYGWNHLIPASTKMPWHKATDADIFAVLALAFVLVLMSLLYVFQRVQAGVFGILGWNSKAKQS